MKPDNEFNHAVDLVSEKTIYRKSLVAALLCKIDFTFIEEHSLDSILDNLKSKPRSAKIFDDMGIVCKFKNYELPNISAKKINGKYAS